MYFKKTNKITNCIMAVTLLTSGMVGVSIPITMHTSNTNTNATTTSQQTGKIIHDSTAQTVNNVNDIIIESVDMEEYSQAIVSNNGIQEVYVWGRNDFGQLGLGDFNNTSIPTKFDMTVFGEYTSIELKFSAIQQLASYALVSTLDGSHKLYTWGSNLYGQLGLGNDNNQPTPQLVSKSDLGDYDQIIQVIPSDQSFSQNYVITVKNKQQKLYGVGDNSLGQLGNNTTTKSNKFVHININNGNYKSIDKVDVSFGSCFALVNNVPPGNLPELQLYVWGRNLEGQLGLGTTNNQLTPRQNTAAPFNTSANLMDLEIDFKMGSAYALNYRTNQLYVWGFNSYSQLGLGDTSHRLNPTLINSSVFGTNTKIEEVQVSSSSQGCSYAIINQDNNLKSIYVWGKNDIGQLGLGNTTNVTTPVVFPLSRIGTSSDKFSDIKKFEFGKGANSYALVAVNNNLQAYVWGGNNYGQLGDGTLTSNSVPTPVKPPISNAEIVDIKCTTSFNTKVMIKQNGVLETYVAGFNVHGQLGLGHNNSVKTFTRILPIHSLDISVIPNKYNITSSFALDRLNFKVGEALKTELAKYIDLQALPGKTNLSIVKSDYNYIKGSLDLTIAANLVYQQFIVDPVYETTEFTVTINGFKQVKDIDMAPVVVTTTLPTNYDADQLYNAFVNNNGEVNRALLAKYVDLTAIPDTAQIHLTRTTNENPAKLDLTLQTNQVYANNGRTTWTNFNTNLSFSFAQTNWGLIIGLSVGGVVLIALIIVGIILYRKKHSSM